MRNRIFGIIGVVWGGAVLAYGLSQGPAQNGSYAAGQIGGMAFGAVLLVVGLYYLATGGGSGQKK
jgi:hypothetical protein